MFRCRAVLVAIATVTVFVYAQPDRSSDYRASLASLEQALALVEKDSGGNSKAVADICIQLSHLRYTLGEYRIGIELAQRALGIYQASLGPDDPAIARALALIGGSHSGAGDYAAAQPFLDRAIAIQERSNPNGDVLAAVLNQAAFNLLRAGDYSRAKLVAERAIAIYEGVPASEEGAGQAYRVLAQILTEFGDQSGAARAEARALALIEKHAGPDDVRVADLLITIGNSAKDQSRLEQARGSFERAGAIYSKRLGPRNTRVGGALDSLAQTLLLMKRYEPAREVFRRALSIQSEALGPRSAWAGNLIQGLAKVAAATGDYAEAKRLYQQNLDIWREQLGPTHPFTVVSLTNFADVLGHLGERQAAFATALDAARFRRDQIATTVRTVEERQALRYAGLKMTSLNTALTLALQGSPEERREAWDMIVRTRALVLDEMAARRRAVRHSGDPRMPQLVEDLANARSELARMVVQGRGTRSNAEYENRLELGRARMQRAEQSLAVLSVGFRRELAKEKAGFADVTAALARGAALVAYSRYEHVDFAGHGDPVPSYVAFVMRGGASAPGMVRIAAAKQVELLVQDWRQEIDREKRSPGRNAARNEAMYRRAGAALRKVVWDPLAAALAGATEIYIVPDGALQMVNFAALPAGANRYLVESAATIHTLSAERDLAAPEHAPTGVRMLAVVIWHSPPPPAAVRLRAPFFEALTPTAPISPRWTSKPCPDRNARSAVWRVCGSNWDGRRTSLAAPPPPRRP